MPLQSRKSARTALILVLTVLSILEISAFTKAESRGIILKPVEDGYIDSLQPLVNFAGANLAVEYFYFRPQKRQRWSFLLFDLTGVPLNDSIESAELYLYALEVHGTLKVGAFRAFDVAWSERDLYWTLARELSVSQTSNNSQQMMDVAWYHFNVKKDVQDALPTGKLTLVLRPDYPQEFEYAAGAVFCSNDQPSRAETPRLEIVYTTGTSRSNKQRVLIKLSIDPPQPQAGKEIRVFGVLESDGLFLKERPVLIEYSLNGSEWKNISTVKTDSDGKFVLTWEPEKVGDTKIRARYMGDVNYDRAENFTLFEVGAFSIGKTVTIGQVEPSYIILVVAVTLVSIIILLWNVKKRRYKFTFQPQTMAEEVAKPEVKLEREISHISTGYKGLDRILYGGLKLGYAIVLTSPAFDEVDLLAHKFLEARLRMDNAVLDITTRLGELELAQKYPNLHYIICNPKIDTANITIPNIFTVKGLDNLTEINLTAIKALDEMGQTGQQKIALIDLLSDILLQQGLTTTREWLFDFISRMKSKSVTTLAILNSQMHTRESLESLLSLFDGQIDLWEEKAGDRTRKFLRVKRMYRERYLDESLPIERSDLL